MLSSRAGEGLSGVGLFLRATAVSVETGIVLEPDLDKAEAAAKEALERLRRTAPSPHSPEMVPGAVGHNNPEELSPNNASAFIDCLLLHI
jgi:hypothetical protein